MNSTDPEEKDLTDPSYSAADFKHDATGGRLRWLASLFVVVSAGFLAFLLLDSKEPEIHFPVHIRGRAALWAVGICGAVWLLLAIWNWRSWLKRNGGR